MKKFVSLAVVALALTACGKKEEPKAATPAPAAAPVAAPAAAPAPAAPAPTASAAPAECDAYVKTVTTCVDKIAASNKQMADVFKKQMDDAKTNWNTVADKASLAGACKAAQDGFMQSAKAMGC